MGVRRTWLLFAVLLVPVGARAGDHKIDASMAASVMDVNGPLSSSAGLHASGAAMLGNKIRWVGFVGELSAHFAPLSHDLRQITFMTGTRLTLPSAQRHWMPFVHVMAGFMDRAGDGQTTGAGGVFAFGGGIDVAPGTYKNWGTRVQVDYLRSLSRARNDSVRYSAGVVYRWVLPHQ